MALRWQGLTCIAILGVALLAQHVDCKNRRNKANAMDELETGNDLNSITYNDEEGDVSSDESLMKGRDSGWDPSFLDILSSDYFDESPTPSKQIKKNQDSFTAVDDEPTFPTEETAESAMDVPPAPEEGEAVTSKAICSGCARDVNLEDPKVHDLAAFAFQQHLNSLEDTELGLHLLEVVKAQTQVVAGQKYMLDIKIAYSNCSKAALFGKQEICAVNPEKETFICTFDILEQKWRNHTELLQAKCDQLQDHQEQDEVEQRDPEEAEARIGELDDDRTGEEADAPTTTVLVSSTPSAVGGDDRKRRKKRDAFKTAGLGGLRDAEEDRSTLMELAKFGVEQLDVIDDDNNARLVMDILSAKKQTISGWLYHLKVRVAQTTCEEGTDVTFEKCKEKIVPPYSICDIKILFQPWQTVQKKVTESQCNQEKTKKGKKLGKQYYFKKDGLSNPTPDNITGKVLLGGFTAVNPDSEDLLRLSDFVLASVDAQSNAMHAQRLVRVIEAQRQIVSGVKTKMIIELGYTKCRKSKELERDKCEIDDSREHNYCSVTVWEQPWVNSKKVTQSKCGRKEELYGGTTGDEEDSRRKRSSPNSPTPTYPGLQPASSAGVIVSDSSLDVDEKKFRAFMTQHEKAYETGEEYQHRLGIFKTNLLKIKLLQEYEEGTATYGVTKFADMTEEEFSKHHLGLRPDLKRKQKTPKPARIPQLPKLPDEFDWRSYNTVTPVKNQGMCGSCWAFSVTGNIEGLYALKHKNLVSFSEQGL